jgi:hypothetical protein
MARTFTIKGRIEAEDAASGVVAGVQGHFESLAKTISDHLVVTLGDLVNVSKTVVNALGSTISEAIASENAVVRLDSALKLAGPSALQLKSALIEQGHALQSTTQFAHEAITSVQALLATFGVQASQLKEATQATADLAARLGIDLDTAAREVGGTIQGFTRGLDRVVPGLKDLGEEALKSGKGITLLAETMKGGAVEAAAAFGGQLEKLKHSITDVKEAIGGIATTSTSATKGLDDASASFERLAVAIEKAQPRTQRELDNLSALVAVVTNGVSRLIEFGTAFDNATQHIMAAEDPSGTLNHILEDLAKNTDEARRATLAWQKSVDDSSASLIRHNELLDRNNRVQGEVAAAQKDAAEIAKGLGLTLESSLNRQLEENSQKLARVEEEYRLQVITARDYQVIVAALAEEHAKLQAALDGTAESVTALNDPLREQLDLNQQLISSNARLATSIRLTGTAYDELRKQVGNTAAVQAGLGAGGKLINFGTMIQFPDGSVRLTDAAGVGGGNFTNLDGSPRRW